MSKQRFPTPPHHGASTHYQVRNSPKVCNIFVYTDKGAGAIETQYKTAEQIQARKSVSRATAYRIIQQSDKRYWLSDLRDKESPRCRAVLPTQQVDDYEAKPAGNPNFRSGIYQQDLARRLRRKNHR